MISGFLEIMRVLAVAGWTYVRFLFRARGGDREAEVSAHLFMLVSALGPMYTKLAQILAAQSGYVSDGVRAGLSATFDRNRVTPFPAIRRQLEREYGQPLAAVFARFDPRPIGSGSVAQVYSATLPTGEHVAVKVIKPGAGRALRSALSAAAILIHVLDRLVPAMRPLRLSENFGDVRDSLLHQTDLGVEAENQRAVARRFTGDPFVIVPFLHVHLSTSAVLVMDHIDGIPVYHTGKLPCDRARIARGMQDAFYTMIYRHGQFHVDPHPGNMLLVADGRLALLDFGMIARLSEEDRSGLNAFHVTSVMRMWPQAVDQFLSVFVQGLRSVRDDGALRRDISALLRRHFEDRARWSTVLFLNEASTVLRAHGLRLRLGMSLLALCLATAEGILHDVDPEIDLWENARAFFGQAPQD